MAPDSAQPNAAASRCGTRAAEARANAVAAIAQRRYSHEAYGTAVHAAWRRIARDTRLLRDLSVGALKTAQTEANGQLILHTVRIRIARGSRVLVDANPSSFDVAGAKGALHGRNGKTLGNVEVSIQDVVGFIKLVHKYHPGHVVVRGKGGQAKSSLPAARGARLPASGCATIAGHKYVVRSFRRTGFAGEHLRIWVLT